MTVKTVAIAGLGAIGKEIADALDRGIPGLRLDKVADAHADHAKSVIGRYTRQPLLVPLDQLTDADIIIEAMPPHLFVDIARPAIEAGKIFVPCSVGALLQHQELIGRAKMTGARIVVPTGAIAGLDAIRAIANEDVESITLKSRKPPVGFKGVRFVEEQGIKLDEIREPTLLFRGNAIDACQNFPANANVAGALSLAGIGPMRTGVEVWADPSITRNIHQIDAKSASVTLSITVENSPSPTNPKTSHLAPLSIIACLAGLAGHVKIGS